MKSRREIGRLIEKEYKTLKENMGYRCIISRGLPFRDNDFWNLFDIICLRKDGGLLVQVKANQIRGLTKSLKIFLPWCPDNFKIIAAIKYVKEDRWREIEIKNA